jgi:hypothetical protein
MLDRPRFANFGYAILMVLNELLSKKLRVSLDWPV